MRYTAIDSDIKEPQCDMRYDTEDMVAIEAEKRPWLSVIIRL